MILPITVFGCALGLLLGDGGATYLSLQLGQDKKEKASRKEYKIHGVGITLSAEQYQAFSKEIQEENLSELLEVKLMDYRELEQSGMQFERVVSMGMISGGV